jgi:hypothetical protein
MTTSLVNGTVTATGGRVRWLTLGAIVGPLLFTLSWLVLGQLSPPYYAPSLTIASHSGAVLPISWLGVGSIGPFMNMALVICGLLLLGGIVGSFHSIPEISAFARWSCTILLALSPLGLIVCGIIPMDSGFPYRSWPTDEISQALSWPLPGPVHHYQLSATYYVSRPLLLPFANPLHSEGFLLTVASPVLSFLVAALTLRRVPRWRPFASGLFFGSPLTLALLVLFFATFNLNRVAIGVSELSLLGLGGVTNRVLILEVHAWFVALAWLALVRSGDQQAGAPGR